MKCAQDESQIKKMEAKMLVALDEQGVTDRIQKLATKLQEMKVNPHL